VGPNSGGDHRNLQLTRGCQIGKPLVAGSSQRELDQNAQEPVADQAKAPWLFSLSLMKKWSALGE
jgi:hypothetical protein